VRTFTAEVSKAKKIRKKRGGRKRTRAPVRAAIITDEHEDGRWKKVDERTRERPMETRGFGGQGDIREPETAAVTYFVTSRYGCCLFRSHSLGPGRP
jgi:hypothetical protein